MSPRECIHREQSPDLRGPNWSACTLKPSISGSETETVWALPHQTTDGHGGTHWILAGRGVQCRWLLKRLPARKRVTLSRPVDPEPAAQESRDCTARTGESVAAPVVATIVAVVPVPAPQCVHRRIVDVIAGNRATGRGPAATRAKPIAQPTLGQFSSRATRGIEGNVLVHSPMLRREDSTTATGAGPSDAWAPSVGAIHAATAG